MKLFLLTLAVADGFSVTRSPSFKSVLRGVLNPDTGSAAMDPAVVARYSAIPQPSDKIQAEYVWIDAVGGTRSKTRTLPANKSALNQVSATWGCRHHSPLGVYLAYLTYLTCRRENTTCADFSAAQMEF